MAVLTLTVKFLTPAPSRRGISFAPARRLPGRATGRATPVGGRATLAARPLSLPTCRGVRKVLAVALLHALAHNLQRAVALRAHAAAGRKA